jgi:hypothetical protein
MSPHGLYGTPVKYKQTAPQFEDEVSRSTALRSFLCWLVPTDLSSESLFYQALHLTDVGNAT